MEFTPHPAWHHEESSLNSSSCDKDLHVLVLTKTYSTTAIISLTKEHVPVQSDTFLLSVISHVHSLSVEASTFSKEDASFPLALQMKVLLMENSKSSTFNVLPQNIKLGILWRGWLGQFQNLLHGSSLNVQTSRFLATVVRKNSIHFSFHRSFTRCKPQGCRN